jgi:predicted sugar kinase
VASNLPPAAGEQDVERAGEMLEEEEPTTGELLKDAASHLYQRFVNRLKKE